jgi:hypothetical protein
MATLILPMLLLLLLLRRRQLHPLLHLLLCPDSWAEEHCFEFSLDTPPAG